MMRVKIQYCVLFGLLSLGFLSLRMEAFGGTHDSSAWVRGVVRASNFVANKGSQETFQLQVIRGAIDSLTGLGVITREISPNHPHHDPLLIEGVERDARFWPDLLGQVTSDLKGNWQDVGLPRSKGKPAKRLIEAQTLGETVFIDLSAFRPYIGRERYGRLVLPGGEAATFFLENLKKPELAVKTWSKGGMGEEDLHPSDYERPFLVPIKEQQPTTFGLVAIHKDARGTVGAFSYVALNGRFRTIEETVANYEEPTWPQATLQVANDYHGRWTKVGETSNPDKPGKLNGAPQIGIWLSINLDAFRPMIGKFRYGNVVLSTRESTWIELVDLLPPERELIAKEHPDWNR